MLLDALLRFVDRHGLTRITEWTFGIVGVLGLFGIALRGTGAVVVVIGSVAFVAVLLLLLSLKRGSRLQEEVRLRDRSMSHMRRALDEEARIEDETELRGRTLKWIERHDVNRSGDSHCVREVTVVAATRTVHFVKMGIAGETLTERQRKSIVFDVRLEPDSARLPIHIDWLSDQKVEVWAFLPEPLRLGNDSVTVRFTWTWPGLFPGWIKGGSDTVGWHFGSQVEHLNYEVRLPAKLAAGKKVRFGLEGLDTEPRHAPSGNGGICIEGAQDAPRVGRPTVLTIELT